MANFTPTGNQLLIKRETYPEDKTKSGIILSTHANTNAPCGRVKGVGMGEYQAGILVPLPFKEGDLVMFRQYAGVEQITVKGERLEVVQVKDVLGIYREDEVTADE